MLETSFWKWSSYPARIKYCVYLDMSINIFVTEQYCARKISFHDTIKSLFFLLIFFGNMWDRKPFRLPYLSHWIIEGGNDQEKKKGNFEIYKTSLLRVFDPPPRAPITLRELPCWISNNLGDTQKHLTNNNSSDMKKYNIKNQTKNSCQEFRNEFRLLRDCAIERVSFLLGRDRPARRSSTTFFFRSLVPYCCCYWTKNQIIKHVARVAPCHWYQIDTVILMSITS
jgi:hypothetical protein